MDLLNLSLLLFHLSVYCTVLFFFPMHKVRVGSLNINGGRDREKRAVISELITREHLDIVFLQETHSDIQNEV